MARKSLFTISALVLFLSAQPAANAAQLITNGGFESGFAGWIRSDQVGSDGTFALQTGTTSPVNADAVPAPPQGVTAAMTDAQGGGTHVLYQDFVVPLNVTVATLTFDRYVNNHAGTFFTPDTLDWSTPTLNQQARVDIITTAADPFSVAPADVLANVFKTNVGDPAVSGYSLVTADLTALFAANAGQTLRLRFAEADNVNIFQFGVDAVSLDVSTGPGGPGGGGGPGVPLPTAAFIALPAALAAVRSARRVKA
jgi:hypothetical protein